ncbi:hypothetical protein LTR82_008258 [Friedmanniomyces endolithicus]|uniref:Uncharacterized protein n=1 Tax=Friedmanniomyces endolithicus TaxID=329885 RepID=A0AAN6FLP1_9PEZI|nr:hypothetical protein LTR82_008258 [Friedmanniomyces endolithicus]
MASQPGFSLESSLPTGKVLSPGEVDAWELKAARRGLQNLKTLLEGQAMLDLLTKQIEEGDAYFKGIIAKSKGQFNERQFFLDSMAPAHPEHYALGPYPMGIVETIGNHICRVRVDNVVEVPDFVKAYGDASYDNKMPVTGFLDDGTLFFYGFQELRDTDDGCDFRFRIIFPAAAPPVLFDEHAEHLAIEFRSWIATAFESHQK